METKPWTLGEAIFRYDADRRRIWIAGQRLHHGATGIALVGAGLVGLAARRLTPRGFVECTLLSTALIAHDWKDRSVWFRRGSQADQI